MAIVFNKPLPKNVTFRALEAEVSRTSAENSEVVTFHPKPFLQIKKGATYMFQAIAENIDWGDLRARDCKYMYKPHITGLYTGIFLTPKILNF